VPDLDDMVGWTTARPVMQLNSSFFSRRAYKNYYTVQDKTFPGTKLANKYAEKAFILAERGLLVAELCRAA